MASKRDEAFEALYQRLSDGGVDVRDRALMRALWDAGRRYEIERQEEITMRYFEQERKPRTSPGLKTRR